MEDNGIPVEPVKLLQTRKSYALLPPLTTPKTPAVRKKRKYDLDESTTKIDEFLQRKEKDKKGPVGDQTLESIAQPLGTPTVVVDKHRLNQQVCEIKFDMGRCIREALALEKDMEHVEADTVVGRVNVEGGGHYEGWAFAEYGELKILNHLRVQEIVLYDRLLSSHVMPCKRMEESVVLYPGTAQDNLDRDIHSM